MPPYVIRVTSLKGGVGKTTIATNLAVALQMRGHKTLLVDYDTSNPCVGFYLGMDKTNIGLVSWLNMKSKFKDVVSVHSPTGLHVVNGQLNTQSYMPTREMTRRMLNEVRKMSYEFVIIDTRPGYYGIESWHNISEALLVMIPEVPSFSATIRAATDFDEIKIRHRLVVNRMKNSKYELHIDEINEAYQNKIVGTFPEDSLIQKSVSEKIPAVLLDERSNFSSKMNQLSNIYSTNAYGQSTYNSIIEKIKAIIAILTNRKS